MVWLCVTKVSLVWPTTEFESVRSESFDINYFTNFSAIVAEKRTKGKNC